MKVPDFAKRVGWAVIRVFRGSFVRRVLIVVFGVFALVLLIWWLCRLDIPNPGLPNSVVTFIKEFMDAKPQLQFVSDLAAFIGVILAIAVPLGIDIVQKVSQFYAGSRTIRERLQNEWQMQWMVPVYLVTVLLALTARFFFLDATTHPEFQRAVNYVLLLLLFLGLIIFAWYLNRLYLYVLDQKGLKQEIEGGMVDTIGKPKRKPEYLDLVEAYGDILVSEARSSNLKTLLDESLPFIEARIKQIVPKGDLENAEQFILSDEFFEIFNKGKQKQPGKSSTRQSSDEALVDSTIAAFDEEFEGKTIDYEQEAKMRLYFDPDRYMLVYLSTLQQIIRIYKEGLDTKNDELTTKAVYSLIRILDYFSGEEGRGFYIELLLRRLQTIARQSATANDVSMYAAASQWYTTVVFGNYVDDDKERFQLDYLTVFDQALYSNLKYIVENNHKQLFTSFVGHLVDGIHEPPHSRSVWDLGHLPLRENTQKLLQSGRSDDIEKITKELVGSVGSVNTIEQVRNWQSRLLELKKLVRPLLSKDGKQSADELSIKLAVDIEEIYKHSNLREQVFSLGAYCMFKKRYDFVKELFDYKQPADSDASWGGNDVQPETVTGVVNFYFKRGVSHRATNFWEGHHGSEIYAKRYFLCLLARALTRNPNETAQLGDLTPSRLSDVTYSVEGLKLVAAELSEDKELLSAMAISKELITESLVPLLDSLNTQAKAKLSEKENNRGLSPSKVKEFKEEAARTFAKEAYVRSLLANYGKVIDESAVRYTGKTLRYGISRVDEKAVFFDEWYVSYGNWGEHYGSDLARSESLSLYQEIKKRCVTSNTINTIEKAVRRCTQPVILSPTRALFRYEDSDKFIPNWRGAENKLPEAEWDGFAGSYVVKGKQIPVFEISYFPKNEAEAIVIDMKKMPNLKVLSPLGDDDASSDRKGALAISVKAFSEDSVMMDDFIAKPPEWLKKVGDADAQRSHLMSKVLIRLYERFELTKKNVKVGYVITVKSEG